MFKPLLIFVSSALLFLYSLPAHAALDYGKQTLIGADFSNADLKGATFYLSDLQDADFSGSDLQGASFFDAKLENANLSNTNMKDVTMDAAILNGANLSNSILEGAFAYNAKFENVNIEGADFTDVLIANDVKSKLCNIADGINSVTNKKTNETLINIGTGKDISIGELADLISKVTRFQGDIIFDQSMPDGTPRKLLDVSTINEMGWSHSISLFDGIKSTYEWYLENISNLRN